MMANLMAWKELLYRRRMRRSTCLSVTLLTFESLTLESWEHIYHISGSSVQGQGYRWLEVIKARAV